MSGALGFEVDAAQEFGKELAVEVGQDDAEGGGLASLQGAGSAVGCEMQFARDLEHPVAGMVANGCTGVEDPGHRGDGHVGQPRDILDGDRQSTFLCTGRRGARRSDAGACRAMKTFTSARL